MEAVSFQDANMDRYVIEGGFSLQGEVEIGGAKNATLPMMAASILATEPVILRRAPQLTDVYTMMQLLRSLHIETYRASTGEICILPTTSPHAFAAESIVGKFRAGFCVLGPLLSRWGTATVSLPGGCKIGPRPVDLHLRGLAALGAEIHLERGYVVAKAKRLHGAEISMLGPYGTSVTGTANVMCASVLASGRTIIRHAAREPEIVDLGRFLLALGARIQGLGESTIEIFGVDQLRGADYVVMPDRIEAATYLIAAAITGGNVVLRGAEPTHMQAVLDVLNQTGAKLDIRDNYLSIESLSRPRAVDISASPYPGVPTDVQAQLMALLTLANGQSMLCDEVFPQRFRHVEELNRLGASIVRRQSGWLVRGIQKLQGATVRASDLRASAALVLAALAARGSTTIASIRHLHRGYDNLEAKLQRLGARIQQVREGKEKRVLVSRPAL